LWAARSAVRCGVAARPRTADGNSRREPRRPLASPERDAFQEDDMTALVNFYNSIRRNDEGQDLLEYALLVALIAIVAVGAVTTAGQTVAAIFTDIAAQI
jgi:pilus assembly protein Flp/PilA